MKNWREWGDGLQGICKLFQNTADKEILVGTRRHVHCPAQEFTHLTS